jgi:hypothetical protein
MKKLGNLEMMGNSIANFNIEPTSEWPTTPQLGRMMNYNNRLFVCVQLQNSNDLPVWIPLTQGIANYTQTQDIASTSWLVPHGLGYRNPIVQVYDAQNEVIIPDNIESLDDNNLVVYLSTAITGTVVIIAPVDQQAVSGPTGIATVGDTLPTTNLFNLRKFTIPRDGTYYYDTRLSRWVKAATTYNAYDIGFMISDAYNAGDTDTFVCPRALRIPVGFTGSTAYQATATAQATINILLDQGIVGTITFNGLVGVFTSSLTDDLIVSAQQTLGLVVTSGSVKDLNVIFNTEMLGV